MNRHIHLAAALLIGAFSALAQAAAPADSGTHHPPGQAQAQSAQAASDLAEGEVRKVDKAAGKITLRHGEIKHLDMPPMTMVFVAAKPEMLEQVKAGDKVRFRAANEGGAFTVIELEAVK